MQSIFLLLYKNYFLFKKINNLKFKFHDEKKKPAYESRFFCEATIGFARFCDVRDRTKIRELAILMDNFRPFI